MYKNILVPVSFENSKDFEGALQAARTLADKDAKITLLHVLEQIPSYAISYVPHDFMEESRKAINERLKQQAATLKNAVGVLVEGHSGRTILEWAESNEVDCIVIASHKPGAADLFLGSTAARVVRHAQCAVHVVR